MASRSTYSFLSLTLITLTYVALCSPLPVTFAAQYNVVSLGAVADGKTDSSKAFLDAWASACSSSGPSTVYVPMGSFYVKAAAFNGPCKSNFITFMIDGTLLASSNYGMIGNSANWIIFRHVTGLNVYGGTFNGQGSGLWACKKSGKSCPGGATYLMQNHGMIVSGVDPRHLSHCILPLGGLKNPKPNQPIKLLFMSPNFNCQENIQFSNSKDIFVSGLSSVNSQTFHIVVNGCQNVTLQGVQVTASGASPNTDGIHVSQSTSVTILNSRIGTGDDCVSIGPGASNLWIENVACGPGHGISIGSLGQNSQEAGVQNVTVKTVMFTGTQNGLRIKSWARPSNGFVRNILFQHAVMNNVQNPIIIDQHYCPGNVGCPTQASGIKISDVTYQDIQGTSATAVAVKFDCSSMNPCTGIKLQDVKLTYGSQVAQASCAHAGGMASGFMQPSSCL